MERLAEKIMLSWGWRRALLAFATGAISVLALPPFNFFAVMFVSLPVLVWLLDGASGSGRAGFWGRLWPSFATGWWFGFGYFLAGLWWLGSALLVEAELFAWALPLAVLGLPALIAVFYGVAAAMARLAWSDGFGRIAVLAAAFGLVEFVRQFLLTGFPWNAIGYTAMPVPLMMQSARWIGLDGMNIAAVFVFAAPALIATRRGRWPGLVLAALLLTVHLGYGAYRLATRPTEAGATMVRIVQPNIDQAAKWQPADRERIFAKLLELSAAAPAGDGRRPDLIIWPETSIPFLLTSNPDALAEIAETLKLGQTLVAGAVRAEIGQGETLNRYYNAVYVIDDGGEIVAAADKYHLVPFGEYLPFAGLLEPLGLETIAESVGGFSPASRRSLLDLPGGLSALPLICYEAIFPAMMEIAGRTGDVLLNVTNDGWFGMTPGPYQHFQQARLRAVETGRPMIRAANSGISAVIDPLGRTVAYLPLGGEGVLDAPLPRSAEAGTGYGQRQLNFWLLFGIMTIVGLSGRIRGDRAIG